MTIPENMLYPRTGDKETIYLKNAISNPNIIVRLPVAQNSCLTVQTIHYLHYLLIHFHCFLKNGIWRKKL